MSSIGLFARVAATRETVVTGLKLAVLVGCVLNLINQGDLVVRAAWQELQWPKVFLTFCVPFCVSVYSATMARLRFDPGTRAFTEGRLHCSHCGRKKCHVAENGIVPDCPVCETKTDWRLSGGTTS